MTVSAQAQVHACGNSRVTAAHTEVFASDESFVDVLDHVDVTLFGQAKTDLYGQSSVTAREESTVEIGTSNDFNLARQLGQTDVLPIRVSAYDQATIQVTGRSEACVLLLNDERITVEAGEATREWWKRTWELTATHLAANPGEDSGCLDRLRELRLRHDPEFYAEEQAANWKPHVAPPKRKSALAE